MPPTTHTRACWRLSRHIAAGAAALTFTAVTKATTPTELQAAYSAQAAAVPAPARGQQLFTERHGRDWSCASCHGAVPTQPGKHASTGKSIGPLAPAANAARFTDAAKAEKWFRRNCNDVLQRACTDQEKGDVLAYLMQLPGGVR